MGCNAVLEQQLTAPDNAPRLDKWVAIAGPFNGVVGIDEPQDNSINDQGKPAVALSYYQIFFQNRKKLNSETSILNIFDDLDNGTKSDGDVTTDSAQ